jgi:hypothetical protein
VNCAAALERKTLMKHPVKNTQRKFPALLDELVPPPLKIEIFHVLRQRVRINEALELAGEAISRFMPRRGSACSPSVPRPEITGRLRTRLISAPVAYETLYQVLEESNRSRTLKLRDAVARFVERRTS